MEGSGSALTGAQPIRNNIWGNPLSPNTSVCTASRVSAISRGSVTGQLASQGMLEETVVLHFDRLEIVSAEPGGQVAIELGTRGAKKR